MFILCINIVRYLNLKNNIEIKIGEIYAYKKNKRED